MKKIFSLRFLLLAILSVFTLSASAKVNKEFVIIIQAGHGGTDPGAKAKDGTLEKDLTLAYAVELQKIAKANNFRVVMCREDDSYFSLDKRAELIKQHQADFFLSIHFDFNEDATKNGTECTVANTSLTMENRILGKFFGAELYTIDGMKFNGVNPSTQKINAVNNLPAPAIMVELGYMSNEKDLTFVKTSAGKTITCQKLLNAIMRYKTHMESNK